MQFIVIHWAKLFHACCNSRDGRERVDHAKERKGEEVPTIEGIYSEKRKRKSCVSLMCHGIHQFLMKKLSASPVATNSPLYSRVHYSYPRPDVMGFKYSKQSFCYVTILIIYLTLDNCLALCGIENSQFSQFKCFLLFI